MQRREELTHMTITEFGGGFARQVKRRTRQLMYFQGDISIPAMYPIQLVPFALLCG